MVSNKQQPDIEELHEFVMDSIDDYYEFEYNFSHNEREGNADEGDDLETVILWEGEGLFEVTIERGYKQRGHNDDEEYIYDMNYQGTHIEGDYDAYVSWLKVKWPEVYEEAMEKWHMANKDRITPEDRAIIEKLSTPPVTIEDRAIVERSYQDYANTVLKGSH